METALGIFCKQPIPGTVKTRLAADIGEEPAARLYEAFLTDIVERMREAAEERILCYAPDDSGARAYFDQISRGDYRLLPQAEGDLGDRLAAFFTQMFHEGRRKVIVIGSDSPTIGKEWIDVSFRLLGRGEEIVEAVLGQSADGGYYLIGLRGDADGLFAGIDWSTSSVYEQQKQRLEEAGFLVKRLNPIPEVDTLDDLARLSNEDLSCCEQTRRVLGELNLP